MYNREQTSQTKRVISRFEILPLLIALLCAASFEARAASTCNIGFPRGTPITVNGAGELGAEWADAAVISSGDACLGQMLDEDGMKNVTVFTKRYTRSDGQPVIAFFFEVRDTSTAATLGGLLANGERIVLQFDPNKSRGPVIVGGGTAETNDYQIVITHKWQSTMGDPDLVAGVTTQIFGLGTVGVCTITSKPRWSSVDLTSSISDANRPSVAVRKDLMPGYKVEVEIPLALFGTPISDIGVAFAVINDFGTNTMGVTDGYGVSFPNSLPVTNTDNPVTGCRGNWVVPDEWGTGFFGPAAGDVSISQMPSFWDSDQIAVHQCNATDATYTWYKDNPCRSVIEAHLRNTTGLPQTRNILFLWAQFGSGEPDEYKVVGFLREQTVGPGMNVGPFNSPVWSNMPRGEIAHPCVRVYVLPPSFVGGFPASFFAPDAIHSRVQVQQMLDAYAAAFGAGSQHLAQKNISGSETVFVCPTCPVAELRNIKELKPASTDAGPELSRRSQRVSSSQEGVSQEAPARAPQGEPLFLPVAYLSPDPEPVLPPQKTGANSDRRPPIVRKPGSTILMSREELARFSRDNVIVQVRTFGFSKSLNEDPRYNFIEHMGGIIQLIPIDMLENQGTVTFQFNTYNAGVERTIFQVVDVFIPPQVAQAQVGLDTQRTVYIANEKRVVRGFVSLPGRGPSRLKHWGLSLHAGVSIPHGNFGTLFKPGPNFAVDLEYRINKTLSLEGIYGWHHFPGETSGAIHVANLNLHQLSLNGRVYGNTSPWRPFLDFGGGAYKFGSGGSTRAGLNVGAGVQFDVKPTVAVEGVYNFHDVFRPGSNTTFSAVQAGVRFRF